MLSNKTIIRVQKDSNFVIVSRFPLEDSRLTFEARGLYAFLLAKPDNWEISLEHLIRSSPAGRDKIKGVLKELIKFKYIRKENRRNQHGRFSFPAYTIFEFPYDGYFTGRENPSTVNPLPVKPDMDKPSMANPLPIKKQITKETDSITTTTNSVSLFWPKGLSEQVKRSIDNLVVGTPEADAQLLLDELAGQLSNISNPIGYFHSLLKRYKEGLFVPAVALAFGAEREKRAANECAVDLANKIAEEKLQKRIAKLKVN
jgi:hypothetical protein